MFDEVLDPESVTNVASVVALCLFRRLAGVGDLSSIKLRLAEVRLRAARVDDK